jgi:hypothetical protein
MNSENAKTNVVALRPVRCSLCQQVVQDSSLHDDSGPLCSECWAGYWAKLWFAVSWFDSSSRVPN